jgi:hypothetical protein
MARLVWEGTPNMARLVWEGHSKHDTDSLGRRALNNQDTVSTLAHRTTLFAASSTSLTSSQKTNQLIGKAKNRANIASGGNQAKGNAAWWNTENNGGQWSHTDCTTSGHEMIPGTRWPPSHTSRLRPLSGPADPGPSLSGLEPPSTWYILSSEHIRGSARGTDGHARVSVGQHVTHKVK